MNRMILAIAAGLMPAVAPVNNLYAQDFLKPVTSFSGARTDPGDASDLISPRAVRDFSKQHKTISDARWYLIKDGFLAEFSQGDVTNKVFYDKKGKRDATLRHYGEKEMPAAIRHNVKSEYYDYTITLVDEIEKGNEITYVIHLENASCLIWLRANKEGVDVMKNIRKS